MLQASTKSHCQCDFVKHALSLSTYVSISCRNLCKTKACLTMMPKYIQSWMILILMIENFRKVLTVTTITPAKSESQPKQVEDLMTAKQLGGRMNHTQSLFLVETPHLFSLFLSFSLLAFYVCFWSWTLYCILIHVTLNCPFLYMVHMSNE